MFAACVEQQLSHTDSAKIVVENLWLRYQQLKETHHSRLQPTWFNSEPRFWEKKTLNFEVLDGTVEGDTGWV